MANFEPLKHDIFCLEAHFLRDEFASLYLMQDQDEVAIIETGTCHSIENLLETLQLLKIDPQQIKYVIPTHIHLDHAGGAGQMMALFEQARLIVHPRGARHMIDPTRLIQGSIEVYGEQQFQQLYGEILPIAAERIDCAYDNDRFQLGSRELLFIDTPGHARHHFCIFDQQSNGIFSGDTFGSGYPPLKNHPRGLIPTTTPIHFDPAAFVTSIDRLLELKPEKMYLTHYGLLENPKMYGPSLKQWITEFADLCTKIRPDDEKGAKALEGAMATLIVDQLSDQFKSEDVHRWLDTDINLNTQGLVHWWRSGQHG
ncbi:MAG: glyoxylase-like metal-dependent hydrolase (beta-lactamase superfamily II) [Gammaproteobacteria bacterium]|jgi:glyoxylase-like metal-dependent hydrolase (beta-lactamase superfamily II)